MADYRISADAQVLRVVQQASSAAEPIIVSAAQTTRLVVTTGAIGKLAKNNRPALLMAL